MTLYSSGMPETHCGKGSTLEHTRDIRDALPSAIRRLKIKSIVDAPCGDCNWIKHLDLKVKYIGIDNARPHIKEARKNIRHWNNAKAIIGDATKEIPTADLVIARHFIQHLQNNEIIDFLSAVKRSKSKFLAITLHGVSENIEIKNKGFRPVNLSLPPFNLGEPFTYIDDVPVLAVYKWKQLK